MGNNKEERVDVYGALVRGHQPYSITPLACLVQEFFYINSMAPPLRHGGGVTNYDPLHEREGVCLI